MVSENKTYLGHAKLITWFSGPFLSKLMREGGIFFYPFTAVKSDEGGIFSSFFCEKYGNV